MRRRDINLSRNMLAPNEIIRWSQRINSAWQKSVDSVLETGRLLIEAKATLEHGSFEAMVRSDLSFGPRTARMLMSIASHPIISNRKHVSDLPASWGTLYELTKLDKVLGDGTLLTHIEDGTITPKTERKDVAAMLQKCSRKAEQIIKVKRDVSSASLANLSGAKLKVPDGKSASEHCLPIVNKETCGEIRSIVKAAKLVGWDLRCYAKARDIILLSERDDLSRADKELAQSAKRMLDETQSVKAAYDLIEPIAKIVWPPNSKRTREADKKRVERFSQSILFVLDTCEAAVGVSIPPMTSGELQSALKQIANARGLLGKLQSSLKERIDAV